MKHTPPGGKAPPGSAERKQWVGTGVNVSLKYDTNTVTSLFRL